jgi:predicted anti-sigma-YlaC factor YlaD
MRRAVHLTALVAGVALAALGVLLVMNAGGSIDLGFAYTAPLIVAALGLTLLASGVQARRRRGG